MDGAQKSSFEIKFEGMTVHKEMIRPAEIENVRANLHVIDGDVIIASYPRSGEFQSHGQHALHFAGVI